MGLEVKSAEVKEMYVLLISLEEKVRRLQRVLEPFVKEELYKGRRVEFTDHPYVVKVDGLHEGEPLIMGTGIKVRTIIERLNLGETPEEIVKDFPILTLAQVYDAISYYYDHKEEIDQLIAENEEALWEAKKNESAST